MLGGGVPVSLSMVFICMSVCVGGSVNESAFAKVSVIGQNRNNSSPCEIELIKLSACHQWFCYWKLID